LCNSKTVEFIGKERKRGKRKMEKGKRKGKKQIWLTLSMKHLNSKEILFVLFCFGRVF